MLHFFIDVINNNPDIDWRALSQNPYAIDILDANRDKIKWYGLVKYLMDKIH
jgi:hypothetical protein